MYGVIYYGDIVGRYFQIANIRNTLPDFVNGYIQGLIDIQRNRFDGLFIRGHLPEFVLDVLREKCPLPDQYKDMDEADAYIMYLILPEITFYDRQIVMQHIGKVSKIDYFMPDCNMEMSHAVVHDEKIPYEDVCSESKISLVIPERSYNETMSEYVMFAMLKGSLALFPRSGIYENYFSPDEYECFDNSREAMEKAEFYLKNEDKRIELAERSRKAVLRMLADKN